MDKNLFSLFIRNKTQKMINHKLLFSRRALILFVLGGGLSISIVTIYCPQRVRNSPEVVVFVKRQV
jgi:hypothetical protein